MYRKIINKTNLDLDNTDLWANFPGRILTNLTHNFRMFSLNQLSNYKTNLTYQNESFIFNENINYENIKFDSKNVYFNKLA